MLDPNYARIRQKRLARVLEEHKLDAVLIGHPKHVYYYTAHLPFWQQHAGFVMFSDVRSALVSATLPKQAAADEVRTYEATWSGTQRQEQPALVAAMLLDILGGANARLRVGIDLSLVTAAVASNSEAICTPLDPHLWQLRRCKDPDELSLMKVGIACCGAMYQRARQIIEPGISELRVYSELSAVATETAGEPLSDFLGNDYACAAPGGPPKNHRVAEQGELYILDLGPAYRGYFSDTARTFSVDRKPTDAQLKAWEVVTGVHPMIERLAKPGARCREIYAAVDDYYRASIGKAFPHHLGHGVGLQPHEFPHLNPKWDDVLQEGEIFTAEPGLYSDELRAGMRIENQYLVTSDGVKNLSPFDMGLA